MFIQCRDHVTQRLWASNCTMKRKKPCLNKCIYSHKNSRGKLNIRITKLCLRGYRIDKIFPLLNCFSKITSDRKAFCFYRLFILPNLQSLDISYNELEYIPNEIQNLRYCIDFPVLTRGGFFSFSRFCWDSFQQAQPAQVMVGQAEICNLATMTCKYFPHFISKIHCFS